MASESWRARNSGRRDLSGKLSRSGEILGCSLCWNSKEIRTFANENGFGLFRSQIIQFWFKSRHKKAFRLEFTPPGLILDQIQAQNVLVLVTLMIKTKIVWVSIFMFQSLHWCLQLRARIQRNCQSSFISMVAPLLLALIGMVLYNLNI